MPATVPDADASLSCVSEGLTVRFLAGDVVDAGEALFDVVNVHRVQPCLLHHLYRPVFPHMVPRPIPPWARETVMQCMAEMV